MKRTYIKLILPLICLIFMASTCDVDYENNRRIVVSGKITDEAGNPLADIPVRTFAEFYLLGKTTTDSSGDFEFISLESDYENLLIRVNYLIDDDFGLIESPYTGIQLINAQDGRPQSNYKLGTLILKNTANLQLNFINTPGDTNTLSYNLSFSDTNCRTVLFNEEGLPGETECYPLHTYTGNFDESSEDFQLKVSSLLGSTVDFTYHLNNGAAQTITIPLNNTQTTYDFEY